MGLSFKSYLININGYESKDFFSYEKYIKKENPEKTRISELFVNNKKEFDLISRNDSVVILMPFINNSDYLIFVVNTIKDFIVNYCDVKNVFFYPYGNLSCVFSLKRISKITKNKGVCWILGLDFLTDDDIYLDSFFFIKSTISNDGVVINLIEFDRKITEKEDIMIFESLKKSISSSLDVLLLPIDGVNEPFWINDIYHLSPWLNHSTQYHFLELVYGDLGANMGLIKFLFSYFKYKEDKSTIFQLDIQDNKTLAGVLLQWN